MATIKFDYNQTINQAKELDELATKMMKKSHAKIKEIKETIDASWDGDAAKIYKKYMNRLADDLSNKSTHLKTISDYLIESANRMKRAEEEAVKAALNI